MLEGNENEHRATDRRTGQLGIIDVANPTLAVIQRLPLQATAFVQSVFSLWLQRILARKKKCASEIYAGEIRFSCE